MDDNANSEWTRQKIINVLCASRLLILADSTYYSGMNPK